MQVGVQKLTRPQHGAFLRLRLFDLDDHVRLREHAGGIRRNLRTGRLVLRIGQTDGGARAGLHQHAMAVGAQIAHAGRRQADAVFMVFDLLG